MSKVIRQDSKERILGNKSYIGDLEVIGKFDIRNASNALIFTFDPDTGVIIAYNTDGDIVWQINTGTGVMSLGAKGVLKVNDGSNNNILIGYQEDGFGVGVDYGMKLARAGYAVETATDAQLIFSSKFSLPRETNIGFGRWNFTDVDTYEDLIDCSCQIDFDDWPDSSVYLEITGKTGAGTAYYQLYNSTDSEAVAGSEASTTSTTTTVFRSGAMTKPTGSKLCFLQYKIVGGSPAFCDIYTSRIVMRYV